MARRRYLSTKISRDKQVNRLAKEYGDFAALLFTWMIAHAADDATIDADPEELKYEVLPGRDDKTIADVEHALAGMRALGLLRDYPAEPPRLQFKPAAFYEYQSYVPENRRAESERTVPQNAAKRRSAPDMPQNAAPVKPSLSVNVNSPLEDPPAASAAPPAGAAPRAAAQPKDELAGLPEDEGLATEWRSRAAALAADNGARVPSRYAATILRDWAQLRAERGHDRPWELESPPAAAHAIAHSRARDGPAPGADFRRFDELMAKKRGGA